VVRPVDPNYLVYVAANSMNQNPWLLNRSQIVDPNRRPTRHRYPPMYITLTQDLPRGTVINLFNSYGNRPVAVTPVNDNADTARILRLPINPPDSIEATLNPNPGPSRPSH
jgi:hypothetical protein